MNIVGWVRSGGQLSSPLLPWQIQKKKPNREWSLRLLVTSCSNYTRERHVLELGPLWYRTGSRPNGPMFFVRGNSANKRLGDSANFLVWLQCWPRHRWNTVSIQNFGRTEESMAVSEWCSASTLDREDSAGLGRTLNYSLEDHNSDIPFWHPLLTSLILAHGTYKARSTPTNR